jgi:hypothetical protein
MKSIKTIIPFIIAFILLITACNKNISIKSDEIDRIKLEVINQAEMPGGMTYSIKLTNNSSLTIIQNNVYISYPIITENGTKGNEFKVEGKNNKIGIKPREEIIINFFMPIEEYKGNTKIDIENYYIEIKGYVEKISEGTHFGKIGGKDSFK